MMVALMVVLMIVMITMINGNKDDDSNDGDDHDDHHFNLDIPGQKAVGWIMIKTMLIIMMIMEIISSLIITTWMFLGTVASGFPYHETLATCQIIFLMLITIVTMVMVVQMVTIMLLPMIMMMHVMQMMIILLLMMTMPTQVIRTRLCMGLK